MRQRSPWWRLLAVLLGLSILAAACGDDDDEAESSDEGSGGGGGQCPDGMKIGFFGALTGDAANLGINIKNGAELAIDQWNEDNPDCEITLEDFDSQGDPAQAPALAQQAVEDDNIVAMVGPAFSGESRQANPLFDEAGLPIVTASATAVDLSEQGWTIFHRALANDGAQGPAVANYILNELGATKVAVIDDASEYGKGLADIVNTTLADGGAEVVATDSIDPTADDYSSTVNKVQAAAPEVVFYGGYYAEAGKLAKQLKDAGVDAQFVSGDGSLDPGFIESAGDAAAEGVVLTCPCAPSPDDFVVGLPGRLRHGPRDVLARGLRLGEHHPRGHQGRELRPRVDQRLHHGHRLHGHHEELRVRLAGRSRGDHDLRLQGAGRRDPARHSHRVIVSH